MSSVAISMNSIVFSSRQSRLFQKAFLARESMRPGGRYEPGSPRVRQILPDLVHQNLGRGSVMLRHSNKVALQFRHEASCPTGRA